MPDSNKAIKIMTIHKSKGLEFPVVIIPSLDFDVKIRSISKYLVEVGDKILYSTVSTKNKIEELAEFATLEEELIFLDKLNLAYVALTRPIERLYAFNYFKSGIGKMFHQELALLAKETSVEEGEEEKEMTETKLREAYAVITFLRSKINEVNLLNSKLLFSNKLFKKHSLTEKQKITVIENFDRASSLREVKLVYATLSEALKSAKINAKPLKESFASKPIASTRPKTIINEGDDMANRLRKLAGLK
jgi:ATP-dependent exoDNAse (exonuclease V) beta subunit